MKPERPLEKDCICNVQLARAYVPFQTMGKVFDSKEALRKGTIFPELYMPNIVDKTSERGGIYYG